ncbi:MAG: holo-[acyl-carrier-protein] synthase [Candidatus Omnitrophica bacterium CG11_big_fil_rev_8_21_14_0_20_63_9]|nr:MAG: holo-[acyl-carrier-protein] synthase [Candidatus Omnitrophica bacterium CG11_big_fil_rev_8_21_14_0_20_63_9]
MQRKRRRESISGKLGLPIGCGIDVIELPRFRRALQRGGRAFVRRIFTPAEEAYAKARPRTRMLHLAGRFAAKEAVIKAISQVDPTRFVAMNQVEVRNDRWGRPHVTLRDRKKRLKVHISLSHVDTVAVATAIVVK